jgi:hypothetical protein
MHARFVVHRNIKLEGTSIPPGSARATAPSPMQHPSYSQQHCTAGAELPLRSFSRTSDDAHGSTHFAHEPHAKRPQNGRMGARCCTMSARQMSTTVRPPAHARRAPHRHRGGTRALMIGPASRSCVGSGLGLLLPMSRCRARAA